MLLLQINPFLIVCLSLWLNAISAIGTLTLKQDESNGSLAEYEFPSDFLFGTASSSYQYEGAWNESGKGESMWDRLTHTRPELIYDHSNADVATDSYHKYKEDVQLVKKIGSNAYRISMSWPRILPEGFANYVSASGVAYYNNIINEMLKNGITPVVTIYHWDLPQVLSELGGWTNPEIVHWIEEYAKVIFATFGDRVKLWSTINEPKISCEFGYGGTFAPALNMSGIADYMCGHNVLLAHAKIYHLYQREFRSKQKGKVGLVVSCSWYEPENNTSSTDIKTAERSYQFDVGWFLHPIFTRKGDYPAIMKRRIMKKSKEQGYPTSRLPRFTSQEIKELKGSASFLGVNFYTATAVRKKSYGHMSYVDDVGKEAVYMEKWANGPGGSLNTPWAFEKLLKRLNREYILPEMYITENGYYDAGDIRDVNRTIYYYDHLRVVLKSIVKHGLDIRGYFAWSLLDNFEWAMGYTRRYGLFKVDFNDTDRPRTAKLSSSFITKVYTSRKIPELSTFLSDNA